MITENPGALVEVPFLLHQKCMQMKLGMFGETPLFFAAARARPRSEQDVRGCQLIFQTALNVDPGAQVRILITLLQRMRDEPDPSVKDALKSCALYLYSLFTENLPPDSPVLNMRVYDRTKTSLSGPSIVSLGSIIFADMGEDAQAIVTELLVAAVRGSPLSFTYVTDSETEQQTPQTIKPLLKLCVQWWPKSVADADIDEYTLLIMPIGQPGVDQTNLLGLAMGNPTLNPLDLRYILSVVGKTTGDSQLGELGNLENLDTAGHTPLQAAISNRAWGNVFQWAHALVSEQFCTNAHVYTHAHIKALVQLIEYGDASHEWERACVALWIRTLAAAPGLFHNIHVHGPTKTIVTLLSHLLCTPGVYPPWEIIGRWIEHSQDFVMFALTNHASRDVCMHLFGIVHEHGHMNVGPDWWSRTRVSHGGRYDSPLVHAMRGRDALDILQSAFSSFPSLQTEANSNPSFRGALTAAYLDRTWVTCDDEGRERRERDIRAAFEGVTSKKRQRGL